MGETPPSGGALTILAGRDEINGEATTRLRESDRRIDAALRLVRHALDGRLTATNFIGGLGRLRRALQLLDEGAEG